MKTREAVVLAGGFGTRLNAVVPDRPKPMAEINGRPFLEYLFDFLMKQGIEKIILSVGYRSEMISGYFGNRYQNLTLCYAAETSPLGTGGGIRFALSQITGDKVFIINGDTFFRISLPRMEEEFHRKKADILLALHPVNNPDRYGVIGLQEKGRVHTFREKGQSTGPSLVNGGIYLMKSGIFSGFDLPPAFSLEKDFLEINAGMLRIFGIPFDNDFIDIGIPETYHEASLFFRNEEIAK
jgi:D-glycero-alpha-D-manno-heptose 1-phosphate guanylyltransferase